MTQEAYDKVSLIYDDLMSEVNYRFWSQYIFDIASKHSQEDSNVLELGAGNCRISELIADKFSRYIATDISLPMLQNSDIDSINKICCDMRYIAVKPGYDFIFSAFDSVNYILKKTGLLKLFNEINRLLNSNGIFTFDVSLENNSLNFTLSKTIERRYNGFEVKKISFYNRHNKIHKNTFQLMRKNGKSFKEVHKQKIHNLETYFELAEKAGLYTQSCYDCFTFNDINKDSERAQFVMRKMNK